MSKYTPHELEILRAECSRIRNYRSMWEHSNVSYAFGLCDKDGCRSRIADGVNSFCCQVEENVLGEVR